MSSTAATRFTQRFGVTHPVVNAPMAGISGGELAAAVDAAGGLGIIGGGYGDLGWIREQWTRAGTAGAGVGRVGVGLILWVLDDPTTKIDELLALGVRTFFLSFGDPTPCVGRIHDAGGLVLHQVNTVDEARQAHAAGVDAIVVQGEEAGGHGRPGAALLELLPVVVDLVAPIPVLAAGGIADAADVARVRDLGAAGVAVGTRFYATHEALESPGAKDLLVTAGPGDTLRTAVFDRLRGPDWPDGYDGRALVNDATRRWHERDADLASAIDTERERYAVAADAGDLSWRAVWAGTGVERITRLDHAADVVAELSAPLRLRTSVIKARTPTWRPRGQRVVFPGSPVGSARGHPTGAFLFVLFANRRLRRLGAQPRTVQHNRSTLRRGPCSGRSVRVKPKELRDSPCLPKGSSGASSA